MRSAADLDRLYEGKTVVLLGNSSSLREMDLDIFRGVVTIGCNRILRTYTPTYTMIADRQPYMQERDEGRLAATGSRLLLSSTIFDESVKGRRADMSGCIPAQPEPGFPWYSWRVGAWHTKFNWETFGDLLASCMNIAGPMLQAAVIMGAKRIGIAGVDMVWPKGKPSHSFGDGKAVGAFPFVGLSLTLTQLRRARQEIERRGVEVANLSPWKGTPFAGVFQGRDAKDFLHAP